MAHSYNGMLLSHKNKNKEVWIQTTNGVDLEDEWVKEAHFRKLYPVISFTWNLLWGLSHLAVFNSLPPHGLNPTRLLCPWDFQSKNTGVGCHFLLQGIFPTQGSNSHLLHWQADSLWLRGTWEAPRHFQQERVRSRLFLGTWLMGWLERESCNLLSSSLRGYAPLNSLVASEYTHLSTPLELALHHELGCHHRTEAPGFPKDWALAKCHRHHDPDAGMSFSPKPLLPLHSRCPVSGTRPNSGPSLVHSLPKYLQHPYWISGMARDPAARLMPTAYSGGHSCDSSCLSSQGQTEACPVLSVPGFYLLSHLSQYQTLPHASPLSPKS